MSLSIMLNGIPICVAITGLIVPISTLPDTVSWVDFHAGAKGAIVHTIFTYHNITLLTIGTC